MIKCKHGQAICKTLYMGGMGILLVALGTAIMFDESQCINLDMLIVGYGVLVLAFLIEERIE